MGNILAFSSLGLVAATFFFWFQRIQSVQVPKNRTPFVVAALTGAALGVASFGSAAGGLATACAVFGILGGLLFGLLVAISPQKTEGAIEVGDNVYSFVGEQASAPNDSGATVSMASYAGTPVLIKFFRGHW